MSGPIRKLGIDLRFIPNDGSPGAGVEHASRELVDVMRELAGGYGFELVGYGNGFSGRTMARQAVEDGCAAMFVPSGAVSPWIRLPAFPWVHDLAIFEHPEWFPQNWLKRQITTRLFLGGLKKASHIFAISEHTKREIVETAGIPSEKITVAYQGIPPVEHRHEKNSGEMPYALIMGTINPRKNVPFIVKLWPEVEKRFGRKAHLIVAGKMGRGVSERELGDAQHIDQPSDAGRDMLIAGASVLLLPSLHEGFGRTALEGMAAGVPVIASDRAAIPEAVGDAGILLDPEDAEVWVQAIVKGLKGELDGTKGPARAARFQWKNTAHTILAKLKEVC
jgi:alpha-1,3-rhamnosyl/mannosyltransferase